MKAGFLEDCNPKVYTMTNEDDLTPWVMFCFCHLYLHHKLQEFLKAQTACILLQVLSNLLPQTNGFLGVCTTDWGYLLHINEMKDTALYVCGRMLTHCNHCIKKMRDSKTVSIILRRLPTASSVTLLGF